MSDSFPERFRAMLFERYPNWRQCEVAPNLEWQSEGDMAVEVPCPSMPDHPLRIETMRGEIILYWAGMHVHCDDWLGKRPEEQFVQQAFDFIAGTLAEEMVIILWWPPRNRTRRPSSGSWEPVANLEKTLRRARYLIAEDKERDPEKHSLVVRSWRGTHNQGEFPVGLE